MKKMQTLLTKITLKPLLHQIKNANLLLSIDRMTKYIVILNVTSMIHKNVINAKKSICISANFRLQNRILPPKH